MLEFFMFGVILGLVKKGPAFLEATPGWNSISSKSCSSMSSSP